MNVGFIGLGKMGRPMTVNLLKAGHRVTVNNRSQGAVTELTGAGAAAAPTPAAVAAAADFVLTCLPTPESVESVYYGPDGLIPAARPGQVFIDHSTVGLGLTRRLAEAAAATGAGFLDAPVSGGVAGAANAALTIMVGGEADTFARARPLFEAMGKNIHHVGPSGSGTVIKLVNQLLVCANMASVVEAVVLGVKAGADPQVILDVIGSSFGGSFMMTRNIPLFLQRKFDTGTTIELLLKDQRLIHELAEELGVRLLMGSQGRAVFGEAKALGYGNADLAGLVLPLEEQAGVEVRRPDPR